MVLPRSAKQPLGLSRVLLPKRTRTFHVREPTANFTSSTPHQDRSCAAVDGTSPGTVYLDQSVPRRSRRPWRVEEYQPYRRWKLSEWFWWPKNNSPVATSSSTRSATSISNRGKMAGQNDTVTSTRGFSSALVGCTVRAALRHFSACHGMQCCQESTVQPFRLLSPQATVRNWTPSSRGPDQ